MARITILGGTGYTGANIAAAAKARGHSVVSYSRHAPAQPIPGVEYRLGDLSGPDVAAAAFADTDVVISAIAPRGELEGAGILRDLERRFAELAAKGSIRFGVIGGAGSLHAFEGGPLVIDTDGFPDAVKPEAREMAGVLADLRAAGPDLDWFFLSPAGGYGSFAPGEALGQYRVGTDVLVTDEDGNSFISGPDLATAVVDEIENPARRRTRFTVAY